MLPRSVKEVADVRPARCGYYCDTLLGAWKPRLLLLIGINLDWELD